MKIGKKQILGALKADLWIKAVDDVFPDLDSYTKLQIQGDSLTDATGKTVTANGGVAVTTSAFSLPSLGRSIAFDGSGDYLTLADSDDWDNGTGDFTYDFDLSLDSLPAEGLAYIVIGQFTNAPNYWNVVLFRDGGTYHLALAAYRTGIEWFVRRQLSALAINTFYNYRIVRTGSTIRLFQNGVQVGVDFSVAVEAFPNIADLLYIGRRADGNYELPGKISNLRVSKGIARSTGDFTPATAPYGGKRTFYVCPSLDGNTDEEYRLLCRFQNDYNGSSNYLIRPNNDSGSNYGRQGMYGINATTGAYRNTAESNLFLSACDSLNSLAQLDTLIYAKSGYSRTFITTEVQTVAGTTITGVSMIGGVWNDTSSNITSLVVYCNQTNGFGVGTSIELWKKVNKI